MKETVKELEEIIVVTKHNVMTIYNVN